MHQCCSVLQLDILWCLSEVAAYPGHQAGVHFNPFKFFLEHNWLDDIESTREVQEKYPDCAAAMDTAVLPSWVKASSLLTWFAVMQGEDCGEGRRRGMSSVSGEGASEGERLR